MDPQSLWQRAALLFDQRRLDLATIELRRLLALQPEHAHAHALLAFALAEQDELDAAAAAAGQAIAADPQLPFAFRALAHVHMRREQYEPAVVAIETAIELDPDDAVPHAALAQVRVRQKQWSQALAAAEAGLALRPDDPDLLNLRSIALTKLGRHAEAVAAVETSLQRDPENPYGHQAHGYALLHAGDLRGAERHFLQALRLDASLEGARAGLVEALKARNPIYRWLLAWFLWLDRFTGPRQVQILVGLWLVSAVGRRALAGQGYETAALLVGYAWIGFVVLTACTGPLCNLMLLLHPVGRHALRAQERRDALWLGLCVAVTVAIAVHGWWTAAFWSSVGWLFWLLFCVPVAGLGLFHSGWSRVVMRSFCAVMPALFVVWLCVEDAAAKMFSAMVLAVVVSTWFVMLAPKGRPRPNRAA